MIRIHRAAERGHVDHGWLQARHSFSFASWYDPRHMGVSALRVINQDRIAGKRGFGQHPHDNMEILTYVLKGRLQHMDSMGNHAVIHAGELQLMSAGTGVVHSEINPGDEPVELLQIWLLPNQQNPAPRYAQKQFPRLPGLHCLVAPDGSSEDTLPIRQDARIYRGILGAGESVQHPGCEDRVIWLQMITGSVQVGDETLEAGDGAEIRQSHALMLTATQDAEFLMFDLP
ncbi:pirin family protein [Perlucidibaca piscinae]|uniref:pirin family protein n=1 Tax=Perlucidibaca piscinae TaxID=392589 RepID=UPI0003B7640C|nr:pirin family protein [Perlucidibaca piscinae]